MAMIQFTHIGKAVVAVNPDLVFCIEAFGQGSVGAYTRIRSTGEAHVDVKESFATVVARLGVSMLKPEPEAEIGEAPEELTPDDEPIRRDSFSWEQN